MSSRVHSAALVGLEAEPIDVEVDTAPGLHVFNIVGLPDMAVKESRDRVGAAIKNSGFAPPHHEGRITVNLAPADLKKEGPAYDLPIAVGFLIATEQLSFDVLGKLFLGELALNGELRHVNGVLPVALMAKERGFKTLFLSEADAAEASLVDGLEIVPVKTLVELVAHLKGEQVINHYPPADLENFFQAVPYQTDMAYIKGQEHVKRALEIAAAGGHNILLFGPPGAGKTLLAKTLPTILPRMTLPEALEVTKIFSIAGRLAPGQPLITEKPFRSPHHTASNTALVGGGSWPKPGEISLAHRGVLFLDELPEFPRTVLESLRQPLEDGVVFISRASGTLKFPAKFTLVAAMNPCPCGYSSDPTRTCTCSSGQIIKYQKKISGPLLDRIDLHVEVPKMKFEKLASEKVAEDSASVRKRVQRARDIQTKRFTAKSDLNIVSNSEIPSRLIKEFCQIDSSTQELLRSAVDQFYLSARGYHRVLKLSRTIADLAGRERIESSHVAEALQYRPKIEK